MRTMPTPSANHVVELKLLEVSSANDSEVVFVPEVLIETASKVPAEVETEEVPLTEWSWTTSVVNAVPPIPSISNE